MTKDSKELNNIYRRLRAAGFNSREINILKFRSEKKIAAYEKWGHRHLNADEPWQKEKEKFLKDSNYIPEVE